ncbi:MAG: hypothetical protein M1832_002073 [Thelocarpon impressellum]|nr:MAG: hypothetical protein M1832_002073 [Thelocarpon impressellum]
MSDAQRYLLTVDGDKQEAARIAQGTASQVEDKTVKLVEIVQTLGEYLTDDDATIRARAVAYFSAVLAALQPNFLTRQHIGVTVQFLCDRVQDASGLREAAEGLAAVQRHDRFLGENAVQLATALFTCSQDLQQHPQGTRFVVYTLLDSVLSAQREALKGMGQDFIVGIVDLVSAEKDPRNLMIIFSMLKVVMVEWDIANHVEAMFDSVYCYFPITFRPPPDDPYGITALDLKVRLRECIASNSLFAGHAFPALLDKLDSTSANVKKDVLQTISACASAYGPAVLANHSSQLWDSIKFEILNAQDEDLADEALIAVRSVTVRLSFGLETTDPQTPLSRYLLSICSECNEQLREPQQKQARPAGRILESVAGASAVAYSIVVKAVMPPLLKVYRETGELGKQQALLDVLNSLLDATIEVIGDWGRSEAVSLSDNPLEEFRDRLFQLSTQALMSTAKEEVSVRMTAVKSIVRLARIRGLLDSAETGMAVQYFDEVLLSDDITGRKELKDEIVNALVEISKYKSGIILDTTFPALLAILPDSDDGGEKRYLPGLEYLARLSVEKNVFEVLLRRLMNKLTLVLKSDLNPAYPTAILSTITYAIGRRDLQSDPDVGRYYEQLVKPLLQRALDPGARAAALDDESVLDGIGRVANLVIRCLPEEELQKTINHGLYVAESCRNPGSWADIPQTTRKTEIVSSHLLAALPRKIELPLKSPKERLELLASHIPLETAPAVRLALLRQLCLITNKWLPSDDVDTIRNIFDAQFDVLADIQADVTSGEKDLHESGQNALRIAFWLTKALVLRADSRANALLDRLIRILAHYTHGASAGRGFSILLAPDDLINKPNHVIVRLLHRQRLFAHCVPQLASSFREAVNLTKPNYLVALAGILGHVPGEVVLPSLDTLSPLLLQSLDLAEADVKAATINTLTVTVRESAIAVEEHVASLIARLLGAATTRNGTNPPRVRLSALSCLRLFPTAFRPELLLPYKKQVTKRLTDVLDDPKRHVRKEAVDCRAAWFRLDEPEDE